MQICKVLNDDVGNRHEHHNAKHQQDKDGFGNHFINLSQTFVAPDSKPNGYTVLLHKHMESCLSLQEQQIGVTQTWNRCME